MKGIIVDMDCMVAVFSNTCVDHAEFKPVSDTILGGDGQLVIGGRTYRKQLNQLRRILTLILELAKSGRVHSLSDASVDAEEARIVALCNDPKFNDPHLVAMVCVSACSIVCTRDHGAMRYLKTARLYPPGRRRPSIYSGKRNSGLLRKK